MTKELIPQIQWAFTQAYNRSFHDPAKIFVGVLTKAKIDQELNATMRSEHALVISLVGTRLGIAPLRMTHFLNETTGREVEIIVDESLNSSVFYQLDSDGSTERRLLMALTERYI